jgi:hypothetical protein
MGSRPLRYTFFSQANEFDLTNIQLTDLMIPTTSGWSVSVESVFITGIADIQSVGNGLALNFYGVAGIATPENITKGNIDSFVIGTAPLDLATTATPNNGNQVGSIIWQNPNTWGTRTKWLVNNSSTMSLVYANQQTTSSHGPDSYDWAQFTLAFYDERTGSDEVI